MCERVVKAQPGFSKAWDVLGLCYFRQGKKRDALDAFQHAVKTGPDNADARDHLARANAAPGRA